MTFSKKTVGIFNKEIENELQELLNYQNEDGGFQAEKPKDRSGLYPTADTIFLISRYLSEKDPGFLRKEEERSVLLGCFRWLLKFRNDTDGGWSQYAISEEDISVVDSTAWVIRALVAYTKIEKIPKEAREHLELLLADEKGSDCDFLIREMKEALKIERNKKTKWSLKWETIESVKAKAESMHANPTYNWLLNNYGKEYTLEILKILLARRAIDWLIESQNKANYGWGLCIDQDSRVYSTFISVLAIREFIEKMHQILSEKTSDKLQSRITKSLEWLQKDKGGCRLKNKNGWTYYPDTSHNRQPERPNVPSTCQALIALLSNGLKPDNYRPELRFLLEPFVRGSKKLPNAWGTEEEIYRLANGFDVRLSWFSLPFLIWALTFFAKDSKDSEFPITDFFLICQYLELFVTKDKRVGLYPGGTEVRTWAVCQYLIALLEARQMIQENEYFRDRFAQFTIYPEIVEDVKASPPIRFFRGTYASDSFLNLALFLGTIGTWFVIVLIQIEERISLLPYFLLVPAAAGVLYFLKSLFELRRHYFNFSNFSKIQLPISALLIGTPIGVLTDVFQNPYSPSSLLGVAAIIVGLIIPVETIIADRRGEKVE